MLLHLANLRPVYLHSSTEDIHYQKLELLLKTEYKTVLLLMGTVLSTNKGLKKEFMSVAEPLRLVE